EDREPDQRLGPQQDDFPRTSYVRAYLMMPKFWVRDRCVPLDDLCNTVDIARSPLPSPHRLKP
ncbi:MAG: hypothetical protein ABJO09_09700, partial [Hyphomicrobiales bacterium]